VFLDSREGRFHQGMRASVTRFRGPWTLSPVPCEAPICAAAHTDRLAGDILGPTAKTLSRLVSATAEAKIRQHRPTARRAVVPLVQHEP